MWWQHTSLNIILGGNWLYQANESIILTVEIHAACMWYVHSLAIQFTIKGNRVTQTYKVSLFIPDIFTKDIVPSYGQTGLDTYVSCKSVCSQMDQLTTPQINDFSCSMLQFCSEIAAFFFTVFGFTRILQIWNEIHRLL